jgi:hypothetical protein
MESADWPMPAGKPKVACSVQKPTGLLRWADWQSPMLQIQRRVFVMGDWHRWPQAFAMGA